MKLTIDTARDSEKEIRKAIEVLESFVGASPDAAREDDTAEPSVDEGSFDMFDDEVVTYD